MVNIVLMPPKQFSYKKVLFNSYFYANILLILAD